MKTTTETVSRRVVVVKFRSFYSVRLSASDSNGRIVGIRQILSTPSQAKAMRSGKAMAKTFGATFRPTIVDLTVAA
jgi:hypothetical protein